MFTFTSHYKRTLQTSLLPQRACFQDAAYHQDTLELRSGQLNNGSQFDNFDLDRSSCTPSYLGVCAAEQSTRVRDEVSKRPEALVFGVFEDGQEVPVCLFLAYKPSPPLLNTHNLSSHPKMMSYMT